MILILLFRFRFGRLGLFRRALGMNSGLGINSLLTDWAAGSGRNWGVEMLRIHAGLPIIRGNSIRPEWPEKR